VHAERIARGGDTIYIRFGGIVTDEYRAELDPSLLDKSEYGRALLISLRDVILLNSSGIGMLLNLNRAMKEQGGKMILVDVPTGVRQVLQFMKLGEILRIADNEQKAEEMLR
jgi:anti-anti-sigma factor